MYKLLSRYPIIAAVLAVSFAAPAHAQDEEPVMDADSVNCVNLRMVRRTEIVDDRNILFHMRGGDIYQNILPRACNGLEREDRFSYKTSLGRLCRLDTINVLYSDGIGFREGNACGLGAFHKIDDETAEALREARKHGPAAEPLPLPEPQEVDDGNDAEETDPR